MSQSSTLSVKERLPRYCYLNLSDDDEETLDLLDQIDREYQLQNVRDTVDNGHDGGAVDSDSVDESDDSDVCNDDDDDDERDDDMQEDNEVPIEKSQADLDFQRKIDSFKANGCTCVKTLGRLNRSIIFQFNHFMNDKCL